MEEHAVKIADYLDNNMDAAEEAAFMHALGEQAVLRQQYEEELLLGSFFETPEEHVLKVSAIVNQPAPAVAGNRKVLFAALQRLTRYKIVATLLLSLTAAVIVTVIFSRKSAKTINARNKKQVQNDTTVDKQPKKGPDETIALITFNHYYKPYTGNNDPVEISMYYNEYRQQHYDKVIAAAETDFQVKGTDGKRKTLQQYMHLYKGLSYLGKNNPAKAIDQFNGVLAQGGKKNPFFQAQWYAALASLKNNDSKRAARLAMEIIETDSPYKADAAGLLKAIQAK